MMRKWNTIEEALKALQEGKLIVVADGKDRENEGDLICSVEGATPENINFMATHGKGLICMPMTRGYTEKLNLQPMVKNNTDNHSTAFTESVDHIDTTTGISAYERSLTAQATLDPSIKSTDFRRPGHMFPLVAKDGGILERPGHTEATVDLLKLAGTEPVGICCEMMASDGSMMNRDELFEYAEKWDMVIINTNQLVQHQLEQENIIEKISSAKMPTQYGEFEIQTFVHRFTGEHHVALVKGDVMNKDNVLCRVHSECLTGEVFHSTRCDCGEQLEESLKMIQEEDEGILIYMRQEGRGIGLVNKIKAYQLQDNGLDTVDANHKLGFKDDERTYEVAAQILKTSEINSIRLMTNNPDKLDQLTDLNVMVNQRIPIIIEPNEDDRGYLKTKVERMGHLFTI